jgi:hypothetical protein
VRTDSQICSSFRSLREDVSRLHAALEGNTSPTFYDWLEGLTYSEAYFVCLGAGPWKYPRRMKVQAEALDWLRARDVSALGKVECFPLTWQRGYAESMTRTLKERSETFDTFCQHVRDKAKRAPTAALHMLYAAAGAPKGAKVLSLFCRDKLKIECFPIDRHVRRHLQRHSLPVSEPALVRICRKAGVESRLAATAFVLTGKVVNPQHETRV